MNSCLCFCSHSGSQPRPVMTSPISWPFIWALFSLNFCHLYSQEHEKATHESSLNFSLTQLTNLPSCRNLTRIFCGPGCQLVKEICGGRVVVLGTGTQPILAILSHCTMSQSGGWWHLTIVYKLLQIPNYPINLNMLTSALWVQEKGRVIVRSQDAWTHPWLLQPMLQLLFSLAASTHSY